MDNGWGLVRRWAPAVCGLIAACAATAAQPAQEPYEPQFGQEGKDVVWVPTPQVLVETMLDMAKVTPEDYVIDLGSGDGRTVITAAKRGVRGLGIEYNADLVEYSTYLAAEEGVSDRAHFVEADIFESDFSEATVLTMFLLTELNRRLKPFILELQPGTRVVSNTFEMGNWVPDKTVRLTDDCTGYCTAHLWIVPAKVEGTWRLPEGQLQLTQRFQTFSGVLQSGNVSIAITDGKLSGDRIHFSADGFRYSGSVTGDLIEGTAESDTTARNWSAVREE